MAARKLVVTFDNAGPWYKGEIVTEEQVGANLDRWLAMGAIAYVGNEDPEPGEVQDLEADLGTIPQPPVEATEPPVKASKKSGGEEPTKEVAEPEPGKATF